MCSNKSLCHLFVALNVFTATVLVQGAFTNSTLYYTKFAAGGGSRRQLEEEVHLERMLRDIFGGLNTSSDAMPPSSRQKRASRFIHYDYSDNAVNLGMEFSVHFLSIPVKKTLDTAMGFLEVLPKTTFNLNALFIGLLFGFVAIAANGLLDANAGTWQSLRNSMGSMMMGAMSPPVEESNRV